jgi:hypothetical protein
MIEIRAVSPASAIAPVRALGQDRPKLVPVVVKDPSITSAEIAPDYGFSVKPANANAFGNVTNILKQRVLEHAGKKSNKHHK